MNSTQAKKPRICYFRGSFLNPFEFQYLEPLQEEFDLTVATIRSHRYDLQDITVSRVELSCLDYLNGIIPRQIAGRSVPNILKTLGYEEVLVGTNGFLSGFDLIHVHEQSFYSTCQIARGKRKYGYKLIAVQDEVNPFWYSWRLPIRNRAVFVRREADLFIARSERAKSALICEGIDSSKIRVIGHGIDIQRFHPGPRNVEFCRSLGIDPDRFIILFVGHLIWTKGIFEIANAAKLLLCEPLFRRMDPLFLMVGEGDERQKLETRLKLLGINQSFLFLGRQSYHRLPDLHRMADIFVLPSISTRHILEQFGIVLIEAMATGKPVVSTYCGAIDEVVGNAGILVQPNDYYRLAEAILKLFKDQALRKELGEDGLVRVKERFSHKSISSALASVYWEVLKR